MTRNTSASSTSSGPVSTEADSQTPPTASDAFLWVHHLSAEDVRAFTAELLQALPGASDANAQEVIVAWRATARIKADPEQYAGTG
jgi:hypothetical protein